MSAYIVTHEHITLLTGTAMRLDLRWFAKGPEGAQDYQRGEPAGPTAIATTKARERRADGSSAAEVARMLRMENLRSVAFRYARPIVSRDLPGYTRDARHERWTAEECWAAQSRIHSFVVIQAIEGYEYQSCEHPGWRDSESFEFCRTLRNALASELAAGAPGRDVADLDELRRWFPPVKHTELANGPPGRGRREATLREGRA